MDIRTTPLLTAREAARHLDMPESTLDAWIASTGDGKPLIHAVDPERRGWPRMPFVAIIEAYVLRSLRQAGASLHDVRAAADTIRREFGDEYALASQRIATDGLDVFVRLADDSLMHGTHGQLALREVLIDHLRFISWDKHGQPTQLRLRQYPEEAEVIIDPRFGWGAPVLARTKVPVTAMLDLWHAGERIETVAREFDLDRDLAEDVLRAASDA